MAAARQLDCDTRRAQALETASVDLRIRVADGAHDARDTRRDERIGAGRLAAVMAAGLERDVGGGALDRLHAGVEREALGVRLAAALVPALAQHAPVAGDHAAHERVRAGAPASPLGQVECAVEQLRVGRVHAPATSPASFCQAAPGEGWS